MFTSGRSTTTTPAPSTGTASPGASAAPPSFNLPGFYGQGSSTLFGGSGRLARPDFEIGVSFGIGYDDNIFQSPTDTPDVVPFLSSLIDNPTPDAIPEPPPVELGLEIIGFREVFVGGGARRRIPIYRTFVIPPDEDEIVFVDNPNKKTSSIFTRSNLNLEMLKFTRRSLFTLDLSGGRTYYWDREEDPIDYNGSFSASYLYKWTPRLQMTARVNSAYLSQPDLARANTPQRQTRGDLINTLGRLDFSYRFTPRISLTGTASYSGNRYTEKLEQTGNYDEWTFGLEGRYLWKPRWTLLAEVRQAQIAYPESPTIDATTTFALIGTEFVLNRRLSGSLRLGSSLKQFKTGDPQIAPYLESTVTYLSTARSSIVWTNRFGFEEVSSPDDERLVYRSTISYQYAFTPRLRGSASVNLIHEIQTNTLTNTEFAQDTFDSNLGLDYQVTRKFNVNLGYSFTITNSNTKVSDYYRNRISFGGQYTF